MDSAGAEKLLGKGGMLFFPIGASKPTRVQGAFVSDSEVENIVKYIKTLPLLSAFNKKNIARIIRHVFDKYVAIVNLQSVATIIDKLNDIELSNVLSLTAVTVSAMFRMPLKVELSVTVKT